MVGGGGGGRRTVDANATPEGKKLYQYIATGVVGLSALQSGIALTWTSPVLPYLTSKDSFVEVDETAESWLTSLMAIGAFVGAVPAGKLADYYGRRKMIFLLNIPFVASWVFILFGTNLITLYIGRFLAGLGSGAICVLAPMYTGEISEPSIRGTISSSYAVLLACGILFCYSVGAVLNFTGLAIACGALSLPFFFLFPYLIESPTWLVQQGLKVEASEALLSFRGQDYDAKAEIAVLQAEADEQETHRGGIRDLVGTKAGRKAMRTCLGLMLFQQLSGIDAVLAYTVTIFQLAKSSIDPYMASIVIGAVEVAMTILTAFIIDKAGRRPLLVFSGSIMAVCLATVGYYFKMKNDGDDVTGIGWLPLASLTTFNIVFSIGYGTVPWTMIGELFPPETKGVAGSISVMLNWTLVFAVTKLFPTMLSHLGEAWTFWCFAILMVVATVFSIFFVPETKGKTLQQIQTKLKRKKKDAVPLQSIPSAQV